MKICRLLLTSLVALLLFGTPTMSLARQAPLAGTASQRPIKLDVHAIDLTRGIFLVRENLPVQGPGVITFLYPELIPGAHGMKGAVDRLAGLEVSADGHILSWRRDRLNDYAFHVAVPPGATNLTVEFQYLAPPNVNYGHVAYTPDMLQLQWENLLLYPAGFDIDEIPVRARVVLPADWNYAAALETQERKGNELTFATTSVRNLVDSPMFAGRFFRTIDLGKAGNAPVRLHLMADDPNLLEMNAAQLKAHKAMVEEAYRLFGSQPFRRYEFLVALSSELGEYGLEHSQSSENVVPPNYLTGWEAPNVLVWRGLLAHEFIHSWNGKYRQPRSYWAEDFSSPRSEELLWVYEGLTNYLTGIIAARAGMFSFQHVLDLTANFAAQYSASPGAEWRPLGDTVYDPLGGAAGPPAWKSWQRFFDFYHGGALVWLEADLLIRRLSGGERSLDDFAKDFFAIEGTETDPNLYDIHDIVAALNRVQPYDWSAFFEDRVSSIRSADTSWLERSGYRLSYAKDFTEFYRAYEVRSGVLDLRHSLGLQLARSSVGKVVDVQWGSPAFRAGIVPGAEIVQVNGRDYTQNAMDEALSDSPGTPLTLTVKNRGRISTVSIPYTGGHRYPRLQRIEGSRDLMWEIYSRSAGEPSTSSSK